MGVKEENIEIVPLGINLNDYDNLPQKDCSNPNTILVRMRNWFSFLEGFMKSRVLTY